MNGMHGKRVMVTGAAGFIGANLVSELVRRGARVHALVRPRTEPWRLADHLPRIAVHRVDLTDREDLASAVRRIEPEVIVHLARSGPDFDDPRREMRDNLVGTMNLLEVTDPMPYESFIHVGSSLEYGPKSHAIKESDPLEPSTSFGVTKAAASLMCQQAARSVGKPIVVLRLFSVYGPWQPASRLVPTVIRAALRDEEVTLTRSEYRRDFVFVEDVVEALILAAGSDHLAGQAINIGSGREWANEDVVELVQDLCGKKINVGAGVFPARPTDTPHWLADIRKAGAALDWRPRHSLRDGLEKAIAWFRTHGNRYPEPAIKNTVEAHAV